MSTQMISPYSTDTFNEIFPSTTEWNQFLTDFSDLTSVLANANKNIVYYLLSAKYGNDPIINLSESQFYLKVATIIYKHAPVWQAKLAVQKDIRDLTLDELVSGSKQIHNEAFNPNTAPATGSDTEIGYINTQIVNNNKRNKLDALAMKWDALRRDATEEFIDHFKKCFSPFIISSCPLLYVSNVIEEEEEDDN